MEDAIHAPPTVVMCTRAHTHSPLASVWRVGRQALPRRARSASAIPPAAGRTRGRTRDCLRTVPDAVTAKHEDSSQPRRRCPQLIPSAFQVRLSGLLSSLRSQPTFMANTPHCSRALSAACRRTRVRTQAHGSGNGASQLTSAKVACRFASSHERARDDAVVSSPTP
jgi:hypothetical protein